MDHYYYYCRQPRAQHQRGAMETNIREGKSGEGEESVLWIASKQQPQQWQVDVDAQPLPSLKTTNGRKNEALHSKDNNKPVRKKPRLASSLPPFLFLVLTSATRTAALSANAEVGSGDWKGLNISEDSRTHFSCHANSYLEFADVTWGSSDHAFSALADMYNACPDHQECMLRPLIDSFGDPHQWTGKELRGRYRCKIVEDFHVSTGLEDTVTTLTCPRGNSIIVDQAMWHPWRILAESKIEDVTYQIRKMCNGRETCLFIPRTVKGTSDEVELPLITKAGKKIIVVTYGCGGDTCVIGNCGEGMCPGNGAKCSCFPDSYRGDDLKCHKKPCAGNPCGNAAGRCIQWARDEYVCLCRSGFKFNNGTCVAETAK